MKTKIIALLSVFMLVSCKNEAQTNAKSELIAKTETMNKENIYQFKVKDLSGDEFDFASLKGKKILIVNSASKCGLTPQYKDLEAIYVKYKDKNFVIVGFPANNFGQQEPGTNDEIGAFCQKNYGVTFPMMSKVSVKGSDMCELYQFLTQKSRNGLQDSQVEWNFQKYLINENGELEKVVSPQVLPTDAEIVDWISK
ncbi:glutathione peroxidase [Flavobacterium chungnamense]|uniref:Glutathione peroxidase n=1 Tax=Flavobacterium chungnamense TaxID=706182 RepID=A0ABP7UZN6_9FLAO